MKPKTIKPSQVCTDYVRLQCTECGGYVIDNNIGGHSDVEANSPVAKLICEDCHTKYKWPKNLDWIKPVFKRG